jgi:hypothetical protein
MILRRPWPTGGDSTIKKIINIDPAYLKEPTSKLMFMLLILVVEFVSSRQHHPVSQK